MDFKTIYLVYNGYRRGYYVERTHKECLELTDIVGIIENVEDLENLVQKFDGNLDRINDYYTIPILIPNNIDEI